MNDQTTIEVPATRAAQPALISGGRPRAIVPADIDQVWRIAGIAIKAGMTPKDFATPERATIAIMHGMEIGLPPMMALQRIAVINGRPAVWGDAVPGIALSTGLVEDWYEAIQGDGEHMVAVCRVKRKGIKTAAERTFSVADAKIAGLWEKAGPWRQYPKRMLQMRARVAFRDLFSDALGGLYIAEELDEGDRGMRDVTPPVETQPLRQQPSLPSAVQEPKVVDQRLEETKTVEKRPLPPLAKTKMAPVSDGLDIPPELDRRKNGKHTFAPWVEELRRAVKEQTDLTTIADAQNRLMTPVEETATAPDWLEGERIVRDAVQAVTGTIIDAG